MSTLRPLQGEVNRWHTRQDKIRNVGFSVILALQISIIFLWAPLAVRGLPLAHEVAEVLTWAMVVTIIAFSQRTGAIFSIVLGLLPRRGTRLQHGLSELKLRMDERRFQRIHARLAPWHGAT